METTTPENEPSTAEKKMYKEGTAHISEESIVS
jgi:hypothetical protein